MEYEGSSQMSATFKSRIVRIRACFKPPPSSPQLSEFWHRSRIVRIRAFFKSSYCSFVSFIRIHCLKLALKVPVDLVIDHSVQIDVARSANAVQANMELEFQHNKERFGFLKWCSNAFNNMLVVPKGSGIVHHMNLEYIGRVVFNNEGMLNPDSVVGTDSHTTMIDGLGVAGWGVGGIDAEAAMLGQMTKKENMVLMMDSEEARARFKHQALLHDYDELLMETEAKKRKLQKTIAKRLKLTAEVKY
ncbi:uncharacterized protein A4U43_C04F7900 [Asparagus officinalis]|uniref:Aconitase/3-isopropylmalate dehydratase large subunit alpha/beta/alpha domain-containing protein n=1 Tax=Asparagus officinalis TaxID=4686 RepID=A0A5P1EZ49_ASPOF|nr:uncharacterized protein A4U43_C04F7900 [Asparagus officinalis]